MPHGKKCHPCPATCGTTEPEKCRIVVAFKQMNGLKDSTTEPEWIEMANGYGLFWKDNGVGGRTYISDEVGGGVTVWDTCLVSESTLLAAIETERLLREKERSIKLEKTIQVKLEEFVRNQQSVPPEFLEALNKEFWNLV